MLVVVSRNPELPSLSEFGLSFWSSGRQFGVSWKSAMLCATVPVRQMCTRIWAR